MENVESAVERNEMRGSSRPDALAGELLPEPPRQERSRRTHDALVAAALSLFSETGYEATSIEGIATQADVAVGAFYLHFRSKRQVLLILLDRLLMELDWPAVAPDADTAAIIERLRDSFCKELQCAGVYRAWREAALRDTSLAAFDARIEAWTTGRAIDLLNTAAALPGARANVDTPTLARMLSVIFWRSLDAPAVDRKALSNTVAAVVAHALFEDAAGIEA
jgi:AcrR family transcriptional regulator